jgi:hypothetical protein
MFQTLSTKLPDAKFQHLVVHFTSSATNNTTLTRLAAADESAASDPPSPAGRGQEFNKVNQPSSLGRGDREAVGEGQIRFAIRDHNCERQY